MVNENVAASSNSDFAVGKLCVGGDWACANGDFETLSHIAARLAEHAVDPLHRQLISFVDVCRYDPEHAVATWMQLKELLLHDRMWPSQ